MGVAFITGLQGDDPHYWKTVATAKHFAVHSGPEADRHAFDARVSAHDLADTYLPHFEAAVRGGRVASVMARVQPRSTARPASPTRRCSGETLRGQWGFDGYVVGDCGAIDDIWKHHKLVAERPPPPPPPRCAPAPTSTAGGAYRHLDEAYERGLITEEDLDRALVRLFTARFRLGHVRSRLRACPGRSSGRSRSNRRLTSRSPARPPRARSCCSRTATGALPLAAFGPPPGGGRADGRRPARAARQLPRHSVSTPSSCSTASAPPRAPAASRSVTPPARGWSRRRPSAIAAAVDAARDSDAVIAFVGLDPRLEGEERGTRFNPGGDRLNLDLPAAQRELVEALFATGKPVIVVLTGGSALAVPWLAARAAAVLYAWYPGAEGGHAVADVLFGDVNPGGRLPITIYRSADDLPPFASYDMRGRTYRYFEGEPLYAFGDGLSYTTFHYNQIGAVAGAYAAAAVELQNTGSRAGRRGRAALHHPAQRAAVRAPAAGWPGSVASRSSRARSES